jgi:DNA-binding NarL/FixJ family response regulator
MRTPIDFLLLEDDDVVARGVMRILAPFGIVVHARTCAEALRLLAETSPLSLITDVTLPDGNGLDVAAYAAAHRRVRRVLVMSGSVDRALLNRASALGATYLIKPVNSNLLRRFAAIVSERIESQVQARLAVWAQRYGLDDEHIASLALAVLGQEVDDKKTVRELLVRTGDKSLTIAVSRLHMELHQERSREENDGGEP